MVKFGKKINELSYEPWADYYLDYNGLKSILEHEIVVDCNQSHDSLSVLSHRITHDFTFKLDLQVRKIVVFLIKQQGLVAAKLQNLFDAMREDLDNNINKNDEQQLARDLLEAAEFMLRLVYFVDLNVTGLRKILKKHDKITRRKISALYLGGRYHGNHYQGYNHLLPPIFQDIHLTALTSVLEAAYLELFVRIGASREQLSEESQRRLAAIQDRSDSALHLVVSHHSPDRSRHSLTLESPVAQDTSLLKGDSEHMVQETRVILRRIHRALQQLKQSNTTVQMLAATMLPLEEGEEGEEEEEDDELSDAASRRPSKLSNILNLLSTFLYMINYYIVVPTCDDYASQLGSNAAFAGIIIGMTPIGAIASTVLYSWWTSYSYKHALIFASVVSLLGNLFYAAGLPYQSLTFVLIGRVLNGFGSARAINRRYIADSVSRSERTAASAAFVTAGALGQAAGPTLATLITVSTAGSSSRYWQAANAPGWLMAILWAAYLVALSLYFEDPPKRSEASVQGHKQLEASSIEERQPLVSTKESATEGVLLIREPLWTNVPVMTTFFLYFVLRVSLEITYCSATLLTGFYFGWSSSISGFYLTIMSLLVLPANLVVAYYLADRYDDRELIWGTHVAMMVGAVVVLHLGSSYTRVQYIVGTVLVWLSSNAMEGPNMSLLSKTLPRAWSKGIINVGLLSTEAGMIGRSVGDVLISACGSNGLENMLNSMFGAFIALGTLSFGVVAWVYDKLEPTDDKDD